MTFNQFIGRYRLSSCDILSAMSVERPITVDEACALKLLLFGNTKDSFGDAWTEQSFYFRSVPPYGFIQKKAGPCGVLAAVQSYVIYELFFGVSCISSTSEPLKLKIADKRNALSRALANILWQAGDKRSATVCMRGDSIVFHTDEAPVILEQDGILEYLHLIYFECKKCLMEYLINFISTMTTEGNGGCILLLYSVILTRGIEKIKTEMDCPESHLIGEDGYCSQEVINLILIGKAVPNLFDGNLELNSGGSETTLHHGIPQQSKIGLLSLFDYHNISPVGDHYKNPRCPIWLLLGDNHFTVLFAKYKDVLESRDCFWLYHYDGLARQRAETTYCIKPFENDCEPPKDKTLPVAVRCIYTRWPQASIEIKDGNDD